MSESPIIFDADITRFIDKTKFDLFDFLPIGVALFSAKGFFTYSNKTFLKMFNLPESVVGQHVSDYFFTGYRSVMESLKSKELVVSASRTSTGADGVSLCYPVVNSMGEARGVLALGISALMGKDAVLALLDTVQTLGMKSSTHKHGEADSTPLCTFESMVGGSDAMRKLRHLGRRFAMSEEPVLVTGESGVGKDLVAQALHAASPRAEQPYIVVNCAAIPHELLESELFGYEKGAFTGARARGMKGKFELAHNGTIFLDEIGEFPLPLQAKLLRVLESGEIQKIAHKGALRSNFRLICATNRNLSEMVSECQFREDLYHRLSVFELNVPPLRERMRDMPMLVHYYITQCVGQERARNIYLDDEVLHAFEEHPWRGNVRELKNVLTYGVYALDCEEHIMTMKHLPARFVSEVESIRKMGPILAPARNVSHLLAEAGTHAEKKMLIDTLESFQYNKVKTAKALGISRSKLYRKLREYDLLADNEEL